MSNENPSDNLTSTEPAAAPTRRKMLGTLAAAGALFSLDAANSAAATTKKTPEPPAPTPPPVPDNLVSMARLRDYKCRRSSSWDRTGGNADFIPVDPGATATLLDVKGAGVITHIWFTINSGDHMHLKNLVLRAWWDGESSPSIEAPIGDFYGLMLGEYFTYQSALLAVAPMKALNAYFQMPFDTAAKITITNEGKVRTNNLYFAIDYTTVAAPPANLGRFHAQYRQAAPCKGWTNNWSSTTRSGKNLNGEDNYVFLEATGRGHFVGVTQAVLQNPGRLVRRRRRHDLHRWRHRSPPSTAPAPRTTTTAHGTSTAGLRQPAQRRAVHHRPRAHRRPLLPLPLAHREPHHLRQVHQSHHRARPRQRPLPTTFIPSPTGTRPNPTPSSRRFRRLRPECQKLSCQVREVETV